MDKQINSDKISQNIGKPLFKVLTILYCSFLIVYCCLRAWYVPITHDEAYTVSNYFHDDFWSVFFYTHSDPNNHMLNSVSGRFFSMLFGDNWFVIRIPSLISLCVILIVLFKILSKEVRPVIMFMGLILITFNPFLTDFFSLARGYSGAFACMAGALYFARLFLESNFTDSKSFAFATILSGLSVLFHLSMLNFFLPFFLTLFLSQWAPQIKAKGLRLEKRDNKKILSSSIIPIIIFGGFLLFVMPVLLKFKQGGEFDFAGTMGFWHNTGTTVIEESYYWQQYPHLESINTGIIIFLWLVIIGATLLIAFPFVLKKKNKLGLPEFLYFLIIAICCFIVLQHLLIGNPYPINRFVLFLYLLFMILAVFVFNRVVQLGNISILAPLVFTGFASWHMIKCTNLSHVKLWDFDADTPLMLKDLEQIAKNDNALSKPIELGINWIFEPSINYYRRYYKQNWLQPTNRIGITKRQKYMYLFNNEVEDLRGWHLKKLKDYPLSNASLYMNMDLDTSKPIYTQYLENTDLNNPNFKMAIDPKNIPASDSLLLQIELSASLERANNMTGITVDWSEKGNYVGIGGCFGSNILQTNKRQTNYLSYKIPPIGSTGPGLAIRTYIDGKTKSTFYSIKANFYLLKK